MEDDDGGVHGDEDPVPARHAEAVRGGEHEDAPDAVGLRHDLQRHEDRAQSTHIATRGQRTIDTHLNRA